MCIDVSKHKRVLGCACSALRECREIAEHASNRPENAAPCFLETRQATSCERRRSGGRHVVHAASRGLYANKVSVIDTSIDFGTYIKSTYLTINAGPGPRPGDGRGASSTLSQQRYLGLTAHSKTARSWEARQGGPFFPASRPTDSSTTGGKARARYATTLTWRPCHTSRRSR